MYVMWHSSSEENLDSPVVKIEERMKLCLTIQRFIHYYCLQVVATRKKERMEIETVVSARQRETTYPGEKKKALNFFSWF